MKCLSKYLTKRKKYKKSSGFFFPFFDFKFAAWRIFTSYRLFLLFSVPVLGFIIGGGGIKWEKNKFKKQKQRGMSGKKKNPLAKGIEMMTIRTNRSRGRIIIALAGGALVFLVNYAILEQVARRAAIDRFRSNWFHSFVMLWDVFYFSCPFLSLPPPFSHVVLHDIWIWKYLSGIRSSPIYNNRGKERKGKAKAEKKREMLRIFSL